MHPRLEPGPLPLLDRPYLHITPLPPSLPPPSLPSHFSPTPTSIARCCGSCTGDCCCCCCQRLGSHLAARRRVEPSPTARAFVWLGTCFIGLTPSAGLRREALLSQPQPSSPAKSSRFDPFQLPAPESDDAVCKREIDHTNDSRLHTLTNFLPTVLLHRPPAPPPPPTRSSQVYSTPQPACSPIPLRYASSLCTATSAYMRLCCTAWRWWWWWAVQQNGWEKVGKRM